MFAAFTPVKWPSDDPGWFADPSGRTCIVSLVNAHHRPLRLQLKAGAESHAAYKTKSRGPCFGAKVSDVDIMVPGSAQNYCMPESFELDEAAEREAGLPPLPFKYDKTLLSGVDDGKGRNWSKFSLAELECYTLDA